MNNADLSPTQDASNGQSPLRSLVTLAQYSDEQTRLISFYFSLSSFSDKSHREELLSIKHLIASAQQKLPMGRDTSGVSEDLEQISNMRESIRAVPSVFRVVFACSDKQIWQEFRLPLCRSISSLEISRNFRIVPLLRALQECDPYVVALIENGKTRAFTVSGEEIHEVKNQFPEADLTLHVDDSRVGWSHHIDANVEDRAQAYLRSTSSLLREWRTEKHYKHLVIGCREDLWGALEPQLVKLGMASKIAGSFHLPGFEATPNQVLDAAKPIFVKRLEKLYEDFWNDLRESPARSVVGIHDVLENLESGHVKKLFLGEIPDQSVFECVNCAKWQLDDGKKCKACGSSELAATPAAELIARKAVLAGIEILAPGAGTSLAPHLVGAQLRY